LSPLSFAASSDINIKVHAPSFILEAFAGVIVPFLMKAGFNDGNFSGRNF
jgi:hypothetical protein